MKKNKSLIERFNKIGLTIELFSTTGNDFVIVAVNFIYTYTLFPPLSLRIT